MTTQYSSPYLEAKSEALENVVASGTKLPVADITIGLDEGCTTSLSLRLASYMLAI